MEFSVIIINTLLMPRRAKFINRLVLLVLIERNETTFILIKTNFAGIAKATTNKFNTEQDKIWPMQPIKDWQNKSINFEKEKFHINK